MIRRLLFFAKTGEIQEADKELNLAFFVKLFFLKLGLLIFYFIIVVLVLGFDLFQGFESKASDCMLITFLNFIILAPILEELIFRNHLNLKLNNIGLALLVAVFLFWGEGFFVVIMGYLILVGLIINYRKPNTKLLLIYLSSLLFAFAHHYQIIDWANMETISKFILKSFPHFISGIILSYLYFRNGILAAMFFHAFWNLLPFFGEWFSRIL